MHTESLSEHELLTVLPLLNQGLEKEDSIGSIWETTVLGSLVFIILDYHTGMTYHLISLDLSHLLCNVLCMDQNTPNTRCLQNSSIFIEFTL